MQKLGQVYFGAACSNRSMLLLQNRFTCAVSARCFYKKGKEGEHEPTSMREPSRNFIERELKENPEFFKAFPHLQLVFDEATEGKDTLAALN